MCCRQLVPLLTHPEPFFAYQALQLLIQATHPAMYDWNPPCGEQLPSNAQQHSSQGSRTGSPVASSASACTSSSESKEDATSQAPSTTHASSAVHPAAGPDCALWRELMQLHQGPLFSSLLQLSPDVFPHSGHMALQFMAFYLLWMQRWWCKVRASR